MTHFNKVQIKPRLLSFLQRQQPIAYSNAEDLYMDLILLRDQLIEYGKLNDELVDYLNEFILKFEEELKNTTEGILDDWIASGKLQELINKEVMEKILQNFKDYLPSVRDYGAKGDGETDDTQAFVDAFEAVDVINVTPGTYMLDRLVIPDGKTVIGIGRPVIKLTGLKNIIPLLVFNNDNSIENLHIMSLRDNAEWNRGDITKKKNIIIDRCTIEGFRHVSTMPNAWGILITESDNVKILNSKFENNTQSDIALVQGCTNIYIDKCYGGSRGLHINIEPNQAKPLSENVNLNSMKLWKLEMRENSFVSDSYKMINVTGCMIDNFVYNGLNTDLTNTSIKNVTQVPSGEFGYGRYFFGGFLGLKNSLKFSSNLLPDPYFDDLNIRLSENAFWEFYTPTSVAESFNRGTDEIGKYFHMNWKSKAVGTSITNNKKIPLKPNTLYMLKFFVKPIYVGTGFYSSLIGKFDIMQGETLLGYNRRLSMGRYTQNDNRNIEQSYIFNSLQGDNLKLSLTPSLGSTEDQLKVYGIGLYEITSDGVFDTDLEIRRTPRIIKESSLSPSYSGNFEENDICYVEDPSILYKVYKNGLWKDVKLSQG